MNAFHQRLLAPLALAVLALVPPAHAAQFDLQSATIADINAAIDAGALSSEKLVQMYLKRIEAYDRQGPKLNAVITLNPKAVAEARALDAERKKTGRRSPLHGIPIVTKDLVDVAGMPTTAGFKPFNAPIPPRDAEIIRRLKAQGAIVLAKVSTANWFGKDDATHPIGLTLNPYNPAHTTGGSSNGTGASMGAYFAAAGIGTDTGGSVMNPSAYNSLMGMVASQGLVSRAGIVPRGATQDRAGPMGRSVYDLAVMLTAMAGWDAEDLFTSQGLGHYPQADWAEQVAKADLKGRRIGVLREMMHDGPAHAAGRAVFEQALADMRKAGAYVVDPVLTGVDLKTQATSAAGRTAEYEKLYIQNAYLARLGPAAPYASIQEMIEKVGHDKFSKLMIDALSLPAPEHDPDYLARQKSRTMLRKLVDDTMTKFDLDALVLPYTTLPPAPLAGGGGGGGGNSLASNNGLPAVLVPGGYINGNLPIAIQFIGRSFDDLTLLQVAHGYEKASKRRKTPELTPPLSGESFSY